MIDQEEFKEPLSQVEDCINILEKNQSYHPMTPQRSPENDDYFLDSFKFQSGTDIKDQQFFNYLNDSFESDKSILAEVEQFSIESDQLSLFSTESCEFYPQNPHLQGQAHSKSTELNNKNEPYTLETRQVKIGRYLSKKDKRVWQRKISYDCRKKVADNRIRFKGRFVKTESITQMIQLQKNAKSIQITKYQNKKKQSLNPEKIQQQSSYKVQKKQKTQKKRNSK